MDELKELSKELSKFCKDNNIASGKVGTLMGLFVRYIEATNKQR